MTLPNPPGAPDSEAAPASVPTIVETPTTSPMAPLSDMASEPVERIGRYLAFARLGRGAMGEVYAAFDPELGRRVAVKLLREGIAESEEMRARHFREAQTMARLTHPNVVAVYDVGISNGRVFIAMELCEGVTLRKWQAGDHDWRERVRVYVAAGRGLAAAHAAGVVHRDFKPDNVLVGDDGAIKVTDFGIAHGRQPLAPTTGAVPIPPPPPSSGRSLLDAALTEVGTMLGTPGYMAPEQYAGATTDPRTDQFCFCIALYEALFGEKPFDDSSFDAQMAAVCDGRIRPLKRRTRAPQRLRSILLRGLSLEPEDRYPSMEALLADLQRDRRRTVGMVLGVASVALVAFGAAVGVRTSLAARDAKVCSGGRPLVEEIWNPGIQESIHAAFRRSGLRYADEAWTKAHTGIDGYAQGWVTAHHEACEATRVRGVQTDAAMQLRMTCLEQRRRALGALTRHLADPDAEVIAKAAQAAYSLPDVDDCSDVMALTSMAPLPASIEARTTIDDLGRELSELHALEPFGRVDVMVPRARSLRERARASGYAPLEADVNMELGTLLRSSGDARAVDSYKEAIVAAERGRADDVKVMAEGALAHLLANHHRFEESADWLALARATDSHADRRLEANLSKVEGWLFFEQDRFTESNDAFKRALPAYAEFYPRSPDYALAMSGAATVAMLAGEPERAMKLSADADALAIALFGEGSSFRGGVLSNRAAVLLEAARYEEALAATDAALAVTADLPATEGRVMNGRFNRVEALLGLTRIDAARATLASEVAVLGASGLDTAREEYGRRWRRLQAKVFVLSGEPDKAIPILNELLPAAGGANASDDSDQDSVAQETLAEARLRTGSPKEAVTRARAALAIDAREKISTPARLEEVADAKLLLAEALLESGAPSVDVRAAFDDVPVKDLPARRGPELRACRARIEGATAKR